MKELAEYFLGGRLISESSHNKNFTGCENCECIQLCFKEFLKICAAPLRVPYDSAKSLPTFLDTLA
jgi:hypothetical protein